MSEQTVPAAVPARAPVAVGKATYTGTAAVAVSAAAMSFDGWWHLALMCGFPKPIAWLPTFAVDVYAMTSGRVWIGHPWVSEETRRYAAGSTIFSVAVSVAAQASYYYMRSIGITSAPWGIIVALAALAPVMLAAVGHLVALLRADVMQYNSRPEPTRPQRKERVSKKPAKTPPPPPNPPAGGGPKPPRGKSEQEITNVQRAVEILLANSRIKPADFQREIGLRERQARTVRQTAAALIAELPDGGNGNGPGTGNGNAPEPATATAIPTPGTADRALPPGTGNGNPPVNGNGNAAPGGAA